MTVPMIACLLIGGTVSDRFDRRRVLLAADLARAAAVGAIAALAFTHALTFTALAVAAAVYSVGTAFFTPSFEAIVPAVVAPRRSRAGELARPVRPADRDAACGARARRLAAGVVRRRHRVRGRRRLVPRVGRGGRLRSVRQVASRSTAASTLAAAAEGLRFVRSHVWLWGTLLSAAIAYLAFLGPTEALLPFVVKNQLHGSAADLGYVFAAGGVGAVGAAVLMANAASRVAT